MADASEQSLLSQIDADMDCWGRGDPVGYGQSAAEDVTFFNNSPAASRVDGRGTFLDLLASWEGQIPPHEYELVDRKTQMYGNIGIVTFSYVARLPQGQVIARARGTLVYRHADEVWRMVHTHWSNQDDD